MVNLIILFDNLDQKPAIENKTKNRLRNPTFIGFTPVMRLDTILGKSPTLFNGGLFLVNNNHMLRNGLTWWVGGMSKLELARFSV